MRLDLYLVEHGFVKTRSQAHDFIKRGLVLVDDEVILKAGFEIKDHTVKMVEKPRFVSRAGEKLLQAIIDFKLDMHDKIVIDIGSSTGGFTDCSLQHGARLVYAYDVGTNQMDEHLKKNDKIQLFEQTNILDAELKPHDLCLIDVSFTSIIPILNHVAQTSHEIVCLIKPQFEAGHMKFKQGVLKDIKIHKVILKHVTDVARQLNYYVYGLKKTEVLGKQGNQEYIMHLKKVPNHMNIELLIGSVL